MKSHWNLLRARLREWLIFDCRPFRSAVGLGGWLAGLCIFRFFDPRRGFALLCRIHRAGLLDLASRHIEKLIRAAVADKTDQHPLCRVLADHVENIRPTPATRKFFADPERLLRSEAIVLKSPGDNERGVLHFYYSYVYAAFAHHFDLPAIARKYFLVLEPSWSGYCDPDLLFMLRLNDPVFVGSIEPRDTDFIAALEANFVPVHFSTSTWVDERVFRPLPDMPKDLDVVMVAGWGSYKRHAPFFAALKKLRAGGCTPRVALVGYRLDLVRADIERLAVHFGVSDLLEIHERLSAQEINVLFNRAKVNVLWSRREGVNRAIIEGMFAGVPCIVHTGFNYGYHYPHINAQTGRFASETTLPHVLQDMIENHATFQPRAWVMEHMSCAGSTARLNEAIRTQALTLGENWSTDIVAKVNMLDGMQYREAADEQRFAADYAFLRSHRRKRAAGA